MAGEGRADGTGSAWELGQCPNPAPLGTGQARELEPSSQGEKKPNNPALKDL